MMPHLPAAPRMDAVTVAAPTTPTPPLSRRRRASAVARDAATLLLPLVIAMALATVWLLARTEAGLLAVRDVDARRAAALVLAVPPAWLAWLLPGVARGATVGQRHADLQVRGNWLARVNRLAFHPLALPLWGWLALVLAAANLPRLAVAVALVAAFTLALALGSTVLWAASPASRALHDRVGRTRLVHAARTESRP